MASTMARSHFPEMAAPITVQHSSLGIIVAVIVASVAVIVALVVVGFFFLKVSHCSLSLQHFVAMK
jgi:hypothetical protein